MGDRHAAGSGSSIRGFCYSTESDWDRGWLQGSRTPCPVSVGEPLPAPRGGGGGGSPPPPPPPPPRCDFHPPMGWQCGTRHRNAAVRCHGARNGGSWFAAVGPLCLGTWRAAPSNGPAMQRHQREGHAKPKAGAGPASPQTCIILLLVAHNGAILHGIDWYCMGLGRYCIGVG